MELNAEYKDWIIDLKAKIRSVQLKAAVAVNSALIQFYWELGKSISEKQTIWGSKFLENLSKDLRNEFPDMKGFSKRNLKYCLYFYNFYKGIYAELPIGQQPVAQIPWGHNILIFSKIKDKKAADYYIRQTIENSWSRDVLDMQIKSDLYGRKGKAVSNFKKTLPEPLSDLAQQTLKDPYIFDFLSLDTKYRERDIEKQLIQHISKFLLELGKGFAFMGNQYHVEVAGNDYYIDLLFYHTKLKCYVVIELKNTNFIPEFAGKLNFYLSAVDSLVKDETDNPTIGILLCKDKNNVEAEFALRDINKPMGVSELRLVDNLPDNLKSSLPTIDELEEELKKLDVDL